MNRISERELLEIGRVTFDPAPEPRKTVARSLAASARRLSFLFMLCGAAAIGYAVARALLGA